VHYGSLSHHLKLVFDVFCLIEYAGSETRINLAVRNADA
jgi:hypothetical protein